MHSLMAFHLAFALHTNRACTSRSDIVLKPIALANTLLLMLEQVGVAGAELSCFYPRATQFDPPPLVSLADCLW